MKIKHSAFLSPITQKGEVEVLETDRPEVAFIGRSNVGKSTFVNTVTLRKNLARTSAKPGKTQEINLFQVELLEPDISLTLADLPGFGFAQFARKKRDYLTDLTVHYLQHRPNLKVVCILNDVRRAAEAEEQALQELLFELKRHCLIILTKCDKLNQSERARLPRTRASEYHLDEHDLFLSGLKTDPLKFWQRVAPLL